ncbi:MBOAT domain containing protein [Trichuris trichiura]|uniref:Lysophospholipid acyltransferase 5 n=1 Tax=Trichuris trichiura TaxID=36087 RepID=A0A077ZGD4_TRITR|nr:MBOAT domain containing protein [Trichuris trichiura]
MCNYGWSTIHSMISVFVAYLLCKVAGGSVFSVVFSYLVAGYHYNMSETYDLSWTMPQCVLTLRLIGLILDVYDGGQPEVTYLAKVLKAPLIDIVCLQSMLSEYQKKAAIKDKPSLLEVAAYSYFYGSSLVGPQVCE